MAEPPPYSDSDGEARDDIGGGSALDATSGPPRWVKVFGITAVVVLVLVVIMLLAGGHNPGRHSGSGRGGHAPPSRLTNRGGQ